MSKDKCLIFFLYVNKDLQKQMNSRQRINPFLLSGSHRDCIYSIDHFRIPGGGAYCSGSTDRIPLRLALRAFGTPRLHSLRALQAQPQHHG
ncbi:UNVERIFIED_CONTAM: hypothetical protein NCL1_17885 [Trichonephila clavipes]